MSAARFPLPACLLLGCLFAVAGCGFRTYEPKPLDPARTAAELNARSLESPALRDYLQQRGVAVDPWPRTDWTLTELTWVALYHAPELDIARSQVAVARAAEVTAAQRPNPAVQFGGQHHSQTTGEKTSPWTVSLVLDLPIVTGGKREARLAQAQALSDGALLDLAAAAWFTRTRVQARYIDAHAAAEEVRLAHGEVALRREELAMLERRLERGFASAAEVAGARTRLAESQLVAARIAARDLETRAALAQALGVPTQSVSRLTLTFADFTAAPALESGVDLRSAALQNRLDIRRGLADYAVAEAALRLEVARQYPDVILRPGYLWDQGDRIWALGSILFLPLANRNEGPILEAEARRDLEADRFLALQARTIATVEARQVGYTAALAEADAAAAVQRDALDRAARTKRRFDAGDADRLEWTRVRLESIAVERAALASRVRGLQARAALEDAVQAPLDGTPAPVADPVMPRLAVDAR
ncbi:MAG: TolC family protein [Burkholderiales bacterium]